MKLSHCILLPALAALSSAQDDDESPKLSFEGTDGICTLSTATGLSLESNCNITGLGADSKLINRLETLEAKVASLEVTTEAILNQTLTPTSQNDPVLIITAPNTVDSLM